MKILALFLPLALYAAQPRYARLGAFDGPVEVQLTAADPWVPAERNLPLPEGAWIRTGAAARVEMEFDDGGVWRLGPDSQGEISDDSRLSTGQRVTLLSLDHGIAFFTGQARGIDSVVLAVPGAHVSMAGLANIRLEAQEGWSQVWVKVGAVRFSCPAAELDLVHGQTTRVEPSNPSRFVLDRDNPAGDLDRWSEQRDDALVNPISALHVMERGGVADLDSAGEWIATDAFGTIWKPKVQAGWVPFRDGRWRWYNQLGYTWISGDSWGWLPYHYGRWARTPELGWFWVPNVAQVFKPGDVYWLRGPRATQGGDIPSGYVNLGTLVQWIYGPGFVGWGPLAPGEPWSGDVAGVPQQYLDLFTTYAEFKPGATLIDPAGFKGQPKDPLSADIFVSALPSPPREAAKLDATRPLVQAGSTRVAPVLPGVTYQSEELPVRTYTPTVQVVTPPPPPPVIVVQAPPPEQPEVAPALVPYPVAVYGGIVVGNAATKSVNAKPAAPAPAPPPVASKPVHLPTPPEPIGRRKHWQDRVEYDLAEEALRHSASPALQIQDLDTWKRRYPHSDYENERNYYYVQAFGRLPNPQPVKLLAYAAPLVEQDVGTLFDPTDIGRAQTLNLLYLATTSAQLLPGGAAREFRTGRIAAQKLLDYLPDFFSHSARPSNVTPDLWNKARADMESAAKHTIAMASARRH